MLSPERELVVWRGDRRCATLVATASGTRFRYDDDFSTTEIPGGGIATDLPREAEAVDTPGRFLPPFFENLLPEGFRANAVRRARRLAPNDAFGMLAAVGRDTIGDVYVLGGEADPPENDPSAEQLDEPDFAAFLAREARVRSAVAGVQPKISDERVTIVREGRDLLKLSPSEFPGLVENEALMMDIARRDCGILTADARIVRDRNGISALSVRRFDRLADGTRLHQEDGCQLLGLDAGQKYDAPLRAVLERAREISSAPQIVSLRWLELWAFSYLIGNGDLHLKNLSLFQSRPGTGLVPTPAYDLVSTLLYPDLYPGMALKMDSKDDNLKAKGFVAFFDRFGLNERIVMRTLASVATGVERRLEDLREVAPSHPAGERAVAILRGRLDRFF